MSSRVAHLLVRDGESRPMAFCGRVPFGDGIIVDSRQKAYAHGGTGVTCHWCRKKIDPKLVAKSTIGSMPVNRNAAAAKNLEVERNELRACLAELWDHDAWGEYEVSPALRARIDAALAHGVDTCGIPSMTIGPCDLPYGHEGDMHSSAGDGFYAEPFKAEHQRRQRVRSGRLR